MIPLVEADESLMARVRDITEPLDVRLETTGPTRFLRSIARSGTTVHVTVRHRRGTVEIDLAEGLVVGARGEISSEVPGVAPTKLEGAAALAVWLGLGSGRVRIERREAPSVANVMSPVDDAIAAADRETPLVAPSLPPPPGPLSIHPPTPALGISRPPPSGQTDARVLVHQLETLLDRLRHTLPPGTLEVPSETAAALVAAASGPTPPSKDAAPRKISLPTRKDSTPPLGSPLPLLAVPGPARMPGAPPKPGLRRATQVGMPVPHLSKPGAPIAPPPKRPVPPPPPPERGEPPTTPLVRPAPPAVIPPPVDEEPPTTKRAVLHEDAHPLIAHPHDEPDVGAMLAAEFALSPPSVPPAIAVPIAAPSAELPTEPGIVLPPVSPLETTDHVVLPPPRPEDLDDVVAIPGARSGGATWIIVGGAVAIALVCVGLAGAWRLGMFTAAAPIATPLAPPSSVVTAPPTSVAAPTTSVVEVAPTTSVVEAAPTTTVELAPPTTTVEVAPPTSVVEVAPPPTTTVELAPPPTSAVDVAPPPETVVEEGDTSDDSGEPSTRGRSDEAQRLVDRANFMRSHGDLPGAEAAYLRVLRTSPNNARAMAGLARLHLARHDARTASTWARRLAEGHLPNAGNYVLLGDALQGAGDTAGARRAWEHALEIAPGYRDARRRLGR